MVWGVGLQGWPLNNRYVVFPRCGISWIILLGLIKYNITSANNLLPLRDPHTLDIRYDKANEITNQSMQLHFILLTVNILLSMLYINTTSIHMEIGEISVLGKVRTEVWCG